MTAMHKGTLATVLTIGHLTFLVSPDRVKRAVQGSWVGLNAVRGELKLQDWTLTGE